MTLATKDLDYVRELVSDRSGNVISSSQGYLVEQKLNSVMLEVGMDSLEELVRELRGHGKAQLGDKVVEAMTINETSFFRDMHPFDALKTSIVPELIESRQATKRLSILCAACSSGQEPYSVAISLRENFPDLANWNIHITATDICDAMLKRTKEGIYTQFEVNRGLPARLLVKHFDRSGIKWSVKPELRKLIECKKLNLAKPWPPLPRFDIVFLRNVLIYFDRDKKLEILKRISDVLRPDGFLLLGGGETLINLNTSFSRHQAGETVCYRPNH